jgi:glutathione S-transferase
VLRSSSIAASKSALHLSTSVRRAFSSSFSALSEAFSAKKARFSTHVVMRPSPASAALSASSLKLIGYRLSSSVMEILHLSNIINSPLNFIDADLEDTKVRNSYALKTPTATLPFLETGIGNISQSISIEIFLSEKFKRDILGKNNFERAKINQWIEFANCEIQNCARELIYPIFRGKTENNMNKLNSENSDKKLKKNLTILEKEFKNGNKYIMGNDITLADVVLFRYLRFFMMFYLTEKIRNSLCPKLTQWFENIMNTKEAIDAYGRTILCKKQLKPLEIKQEKKVNKILDKGADNISENKEIKKEKNILDLLPPSKFDLKNFKKKFF